MRKFLFVPGLLLGIVLGVVLSLYLRTGEKLLSALTPVNASKPLVHCANELDTSSWNTYRNNTYDIELKYPKGFSIQEQPDRLVISPAANSGASTVDPSASIVLQKIKGELKPQILPEMRQAGWKIADRQVYALETTFFTNDDQTLSAIDLFVRDFPLHQNTGDYTMIRATMTVGQSEFQAARNAKIVDFDSILTTPEQILSTFRFLQYDELPGRDTGEAHPF